MVPSPRQEKPVTSGNRKASHPTSYRLGSCRVYTPVPCIGVDLAYLELVLLDRPQTELVSARLNEALGDISTPHVDVAAVK